jgi:hypothetical protein
MSNGNSNYYAYGKAQRSTVNSAPTPVQQTHQLFNNNRPNTSMIKNNNNNNNNNTPVIMRTLEKQQSSLSGVGGSPLYRPISATDLRATATGTSHKPTFGRKQFSNQTNMTSNLAAKNLFGNYAQTQGTITANGFNAIRKWW